MFFVNDFALCVNKNIRVYGGEFDGDVVISEPKKEHWYAKEVKTAKGDFDVKFLQKKAGDESIYKFIYIALVPKGFELPPLVAGAEFLSLVEHAKDSMRGLLGVGSELV